MKVEQPVNDLIKEVEIKLSAAEESDYFDTQFEYGEKQGKIDTLKYVLSKLIEIKRNYLLAIFLLMISLQATASDPFKQWNNLSDFDKHRTTCTAIAWSATIVGCKLTHDCQWKGAVIGTAVPLVIGGLKEVVYDKYLGLGVLSGKDMVGNAVGTAVGVVAGVMCNGLANHIREKRKELRSLKFYNPLQT
jgi:hypothetical protein